MDKAIHTSVQFKYYILITLTFWSIKHCWKSDVDIFLELCLNKSIRIVNLLFLPVVANSETQQMPHCGPRKDRSILLKTINSFYLLVPTKHRIMLLMLVPGVLAKKGLNISRSVQFSFSRDS